MRLAKNRKPHKRTTGVSSYCTICFSLAIRTKISFTNGKNQIEPVEHPVFWQYFIPNAPAYLTYNLNTNLCLANGTKIHLHSLSFSSALIENFVHDKENRTPTGTIITLMGDSVPTAINFTIDIDSSSSQHKQACLEKLKQFSPYLLDILGYQ